MLFKTLFILIVYYKTKLANWQVNYVYDSYQIYVIISITQKMKTYKMINIYYLYLKKQKKYSLFVALRIINNITYRFAVFFVFL